ncbi:hypothetical protein [Changpingibacter yushuensis]|uniref:hypothetical protein n=1 Tax=Changpingibacter yushuensis TaxID=2758440 RepID=UPI00165E80ED|nr:hypothetical protein [Changpingibacter yushuensis]
MTTNNMNGEIMDRLRELCADAVQTAREATTLSAADFAEGKAAGLAFALRLLEEDAAQTTVLDIRGDAA